LVLFKIKDYETNSRKSTGTASRSAGRSVVTGANSAGMWKFYTEDSPGLKVYVP
jgi:hypothetical protein